MQSETYAPGYSALVMSFMQQRTAESHAGFFLPQLRRGWRVLDAGCGPGTITLGLAGAVAPGQVVGIDIEDSQFGAAREEALRQRLDIEFHKASVYALPFPEASFDAVFSHALLEHLGDPGAAIAEMRRVLKPGGLIGLRAGDIGGLLMDAVPEGAAQAFGANLANPHLGRHLGRLLRQAGFTVPRVTASYEVITETLGKMGPALAAQLPAGASCSLPGPAADPPFVALAWCEATARAGYPA